MNEILTWDKIVVYVVVVTLDHFVKFRVGDEHRLLRIYGRRVSFSRRRRK